MATQTLLLFLSPVQLIAIAALTCGLIYTLLLQRESFPLKAPQLVSGDLPAVGQLGFWTERFDFWSRALSQTKSKNFSFHIGKHQIVGTNSEQGRKTFFDNRGLGFAEGYAVLFGQNPSVPDEAEKEGSSLADYFKRRVTVMLKNEQFEKALPTLISDVKTRLAELVASSKKVTDPFDSIYKIVYLLTTRAVGATEIAEDRKLLDKTLRLFETIEQTATPYQIMFPWLPSPALLKRFIAGTQMHVIFQKIVNARKKSEKRIDDPLQFLIDQGDSMSRIISFVIGALFAGQLNSGINAGWVLCYLATSPRWLAEVRKEILAAASKHNPNSTLPLTEQLSNLPLSAWESDFPVLDLCLRDSIRLQVHGTGFRRNLTSKPIPLSTDPDGEVLPPGAFLLYHFGMHHRDPALYADPLVWDPSRYLPDRAEDKKAPYAFLAWGGGRHPCLGMRFAKLEQNIIAAFFLAMFDFELLDEHGTVMEAPPEIDKNSWQASKPRQKVFLRYSLRDGAV